MTRDERAPISRPTDAVFTTSEVPERYDKPCSIGHWQLRDLMHFDDTGDAVYVCHSREVQRYSFKNKRTTPTMVLGWVATSMAVRYGYVAAGNQASDVKIWSTMEGKVIYEERINSGSVNNAMHFSRTPDALELHVCSNDCVVRTFQVSESQDTWGAERRVRLAQATQFETPINYAAVSPDGRSMCCVGDNRVTFLADRRESGEWEITRSLKEFADAGMMCDWSPQGKIFAAGAQDGRCMVWDARDRRLVARYTVQNAVRSVKFSSSPMDLLAFAEQEGRAHLVDTRMLDKKQVLKLPASGASTRENMVAGMHFAPDGTRLALACEAGISVWDVDTSTRRTFSDAELL